MEISGLGPVGSAVNAASVIHPQKPPDIPPIEHSGASGQTGADAKGSGPQPGHIPAPQQPPRIDPDTPAGPPPSFDVSLLEVENDLQQAIARIEAARNQARDVKGVQADAPGPAPHAQPIPTATTNTSTPEDLVAVVQAELPYDRVAVDAASGTAR